MKPAHYYARPITPLIKSGPYWLYEGGIGEDRAILIDGGHILRAHIERHGGVKAGLVSRAKLVKKLSGGKRAIAMLPTGEEILLNNSPKSVTEGQSLTIEITREAIDEKSRFKWPLAKASDKPECNAPSLLSRIESSDYPVQHCHAHEDDHFAQVGWYDVIEEARSGHVDFAGGSLDIAITPAMTLIDVDGDLHGGALAKAGAVASADAICRLGLQGSIGIDFPDAGGKAARQEVCEAFDDAMAINCERTAINGFGLMHIVTRRMRPSLPELLKGDVITGHAMDLQRLAQRFDGAGTIQIAAHPAIIEKIENNADWMDALSKQAGRAISLRADAKIKIDGGYIEKG